ncbi:MAG: thioredoxin domain-containing protein [Nitrospira sp.]|nr:thioredoxin domain-containing protein [Nitrospira sp.]
MNRLSSEKSAYLQNAAKQSIQWYPWSDDPFEIAARENKPIFLSSGAVWCHWCHVMASECFHHSGIIAYLNQHFISIKLDRDEHPDIDRRYQMSVSAMGGGGGWPLSVFLTHEKKPFFGGTYFPPEDSMGRTGFLKVLQSVQELYLNKQADIAEYTAKMMDALRATSTDISDIAPSMLEDSVCKILQECDLETGGFGDAPKFAMSGTLELLIDRYFITEDEGLGLAVNKTLQAMAAGGFYDQIGGGFHRYSTDAHWIIPHFEKMTDDNAWLLRNYLTAFAVFQDERYRDIAISITRFVREVLSDSEGGFYASQDADLVPEDEGGYFTWARSECRAVMTEEEYIVIAEHMFHEAGEMHHDRDRHVLFQVKGLGEIAAATGLKEEVVAGHIQSGKEKMLQARRKREAPYIDRMMYASLNGMMISAFLLGFRILRDSALRDFAIKTLDKVIGKLYRDGILYHCEGVAGLLDDYAHMTDALIAAYESTGVQKYLQLAEELALWCMNNIMDQKNGGFYDTKEPLLDIRIKGIEDVPHPSVNAVMIRALLRLSALTGNARFHEAAQAALKHFTVRAEEIGISAGYYYSALDNYYSSLELKLSAAEGSDISNAALHTYAPYISIVREGDESQVTACAGGRCFEPILQAGKLTAFIKGKMYLK